MSKKKTGDPSLDIANQYEAGTLSRKVEDPHPEFTEGVFAPVYAETPDELEARIAKLESRLDWLYRWTLSDRNGHKYYSPAFTERAKDDRFPLPDYDAPGGPRKPQGEP